jgi:hypothetical protein
MLLYFSNQIITAATAPNASGVVLESVRLAGLRRLQPVIPDRTTFRAPTKRKTHGHYAEDQC